MTEADVVQKYSDVRRVEGPHDHLTLEVGFLHVLKRFFLVETNHSGLAGGCFRKKMKFELALLWDSLDPYGSRKNEKKLH